ncbi:GTP-binding protein ryH1, putative [Entamoeba invadens IP1]|uniref:GTP-binding protein ryH1, putative n=1 Tax=Entamoeba invadens IP1 TaxID=370355 RepID=A0A0A1TVF3_ENTIV|nr:GTP-binding protein ryH1, putative [Entamoeba invadens IP1]ELP84377.1 GTP-binding protein ryH1, putative [Entamoeba invadens IP1]|eukprot:XP_004183723.1 GTP-binding protein ryH1, putative [Entamoeba invadens IP1]
MNPVFANCPEYKILFVGQYNTGKVQLIQAFRTPQPFDDVITKIGVDFAVSSLLVERTIVRVQLWDVEVGDRFKNLTQTFYRGSDAVLYFYSAINHQTFDEMKREIVRNFKMVSKPEPRYVLVETNSDNDLLRDVNEEEIIEVENLLGIEDHIKINKITHSKAVDLVMQIVSIMMSNAEQENTTKTQQKIVKTHEQPKKNEKGGCLCNNFIPLFVIFDQLYHGLLFYCRYL